MKKGVPWRRYMMGVVMFLMFLPPGMWVPSLPNILEAHNARWVLPYFAVLSPLMAIFSALVFGALSDRKIDARYLMGGLGLTGAGFLWLAFSSLQWGWHPIWFLIFQGCNALISAPMIPLITKIQLVNLPNAEKSFPMYSLGGTLGWLCGSLLVSLLALDFSAKVGQIGTFIRVGMSLLCFTLPATLPTDRTSRGWQASLGLTAFTLLKNKELRIFYIASALLAIPGVAQFMVTPTMLAEFGSAHPTAQMSLGQAAEIGALLLLSLLAGRFKMRWFLICGMSLAVFRFGLFALGADLNALTIILIGTALHGPVYTFMTVAGRIYLDKRVPDTMRGQAQALYTLLTFNVAAIAGALLCENLFQSQVDGRAGWGSFWLILSALSTIPLIYFAAGLRGEKRDVKVEP